MISGWRSSAPRATLPMLGTSAAVPTFQSFSLGGVPAGGPGTVQPSSVLPSFSNDVEPAPPGPTMSSTTTPRCWIVSSLT